MKWVNAKIGGSPLYYAFSYDSRDELTGADNSTNAYDATYSYDDNGNMATLVRGAASTGTYNYNGDEANTNRLDDVTNLTSDDNWDYDPSGRQTQDTAGGFTAATFHFPGAAFHDITISGETLKMRYNMGNRRLRKENTEQGGITTDYVRDQNGNVLAVYEDGTLVERYVWGPLGLVKILKGENGSTTPYFVINDYLGYVRTVVNSGGSAVAANDYWPYGKSLRSSVDANCDSRFQFGAKEFDTDLNVDLYYFEARFYSPEVGRFVSRDPLRIGWSPFPFAGNNPIRYVEPTGRESDDPPGTYKGKTAEQWQKEAKYAETAVSILEIMRVAGEVAGLIATPLHLLKIVKLVWEFGPAALSVAEALGWKAELDLHAIQAIINNLYGHN